MADVGWDAYRHPQVLPNDDGISLEQTVAAKPKGRVVVKSAIGDPRIADLLTEDPLPRIY